MINYGSTATRSWRKIG